MNPLNILEKFDSDLYGFFKTEMSRQQTALSFIPDENSTSPLCASIMGSILVNMAEKTGLSRTANLEKVASERLCELFRARRANVRTLTIEAASRVVFQSLTRRGDVVMSLDLRKKEHCNSEALAYRFVNFGVDPKTQKLDMDNLEKQALQYRPHLIILSPINYPSPIDYERLSGIARSCGAFLWCDISQTAGLVAAGVVDSPVPYADVVTFTANGAMQGPQSAVILSTNDVGTIVERVAASTGHPGLLTPQLAALAARVHEMSEPSYKSYAEAVLSNAKALARGLSQGGLKTLCGEPQSHLVMLDTRNCALSARGAQELLTDLGIRVRICNMLTSDPHIRYESVRLSSLPITTRGLEEPACERIGRDIATYLVNPNDANAGMLAATVRELTDKLPIFNRKWMSRRLLTALGKE